MTTYYEWHEEENDLTHLEFEALEDYLNNQHEDTDSEYDADIVSQFRDAYCGQWDSLGSFVREQVLDQEFIPDYMQNYIDWDTLAENEWSHDYWESDNGHIFRAH